MRERPILFSTPMVQAILKFTKKMTRRTKGLEKINENPNEWMFDGLHAGKYFQFMNKETGYHEILTCPYGKPGDILWVRETWCKNGEAYLYKAGCPHLQDNMWIKWRPSIFMPKEACRIKLRVTNVRVERLQDITEDDAKTEGCCSFQDRLGDGKFEDVMEFDLSARDAFCELWQSLNLKRGYGWQVNPWVWVIEFAIL